MEHELMKHTKKIQAVIKKVDLPVAKKVKELLIEISIITFAITVSIWLHTWSEHRHHQKEVKDFLSDLKEDLHTDIRNIISSDSIIQNKIENFLYLLHLNKIQADSILKHKGSVYISSNVGTTKISNGNYEGFKSSGKIGFIENKKLKKKILKYYQELMPEIIETEKITTDLTFKLTDYLTENTDQNFLVTVLKVQFKSRLRILLSMTNYASVQYQKTILVAEDIINEINNQLKQK